VKVSGRVYIRKRKRADQWYVQYRVGERRFNRRLGPVWKERGRPPEGFFTKRKAQEALDAILTDARRGELPGAEPMRDHHTYGEACREWLRYVEHEKGGSPSTARDYANAARSRLIPLFGKDTPVATISTQDIDAVREKLLAEGELSRRTVQKLLVLNYGILKRAKRKGWIPVNPAEDAERVTVKPSGDFNVLAPEEVMAVARNADDEQDAALFIFAGFTGLRMGELLALRCEDVDFAASAVLVRHNWVRGRLKKPKSGKVRSVPLIDQAATALEALSRRANFTQPGDLVFVSETGTYVDAYDLRQRFYGALKRAGLGHKRQVDQPLRFHDLRHTFGTLAVQVWPLVDVQSYMGHANINTTMVYAHHVPKRDAAETLTRLVSAAVTADGVDGLRQEIAG
jgi:integrase